MRPWQLALYQENAAGVTRPVSKELAAGGYRIARAQREVCFADTAPCMKADDVLLLNQRRNEPKPGWQVQVQEIRELEHARSRSVVAANLEGLLERFERRPQPLARFECSLKCGKSFFGPASSAEFVKPGGVVRDTLKIGQGI